MPFLRFYATDRMRLMEISRKMTDKIQEVLECPREHIVLELMPAERICDGRCVENNWPYVEVSWFQRPPEVQQQVARIISACLAEAGYADSDVYFQEMDNRNYYVNGK